MGIAQRKLKFDGKAVVGETIRAYDFHPFAGRPDVYIEGIVRDIRQVPEGFKAFVVECTFDTNASRVGSTIYVPLETSFADYDSRIINLSSF